MEPQGSNLETTLKLQKLFNARGYQAEVMYAVESGFKKIFLCWSRRAGKDVVCFNILLRAALSEIGVYFYCLPCYSHGRKVIWDTILSESGMRMIDFIPKGIAMKINDQQMKITLWNGSIIQIVGSDKAKQTLVGTNPKGVIFSEWQVSNAESYEYIRPALLYNQGFAIFNGTPRGYNHFYEMYNLAKTSPDWFCSYKTCYDTQHIPSAELAKEKASMSIDKFMQEYECSFQAGISGTFYGRQMDQMRLDGRIGNCPYEPMHPVYTSFDLGVADPSCIIFFQLIGNCIRLVDYEEHTDRGLDWYARLLDSKGYKYAGHFAPHDIKVRELGSGAMSRLEIAHNLGLDFQVVPNLPIDDGIEATRMILPRTWIDERKCERLINALDNYRREYDEERKTYREKPLHDWSSHPCFTADTLILTRNGMRQIIDISDNDEILTIYGWEKCTKAVKTQKNAQLVEVKFVDGTTVRCTLEHKFSTKNGWIFAKDLKKDMQILSSLMFSRNISMVDYIDFGQEKDITPKVDQDFIGMCGKKLLGIFQKIIIFIIKTIILLITTFGILSVYLKKIIYHCQDLMLKVFHRKQEMRPQNGTNQKREDYGTADIASNQNHGLNGSMKTDLVCTARRYLNALLEKMDTHKNTVTPIAKPCIIESVTFLNEREDVYCIYVPDYNHFSLSNGAIVHNCDAMRMLALALPSCTQDTSPEELERNWRQAKFGTNQALPPVFRDQRRGIW